MLSLTRKTDYALVALAHLADRRDAGEAAVSARQIAEQFGLPMALLMNILKELSHAQIVSSTRGVHGGYTLAVEPESISLLQIIGAMEGSFRLAQCAGDGEEMSEHDPDRCSLTGCCPIREPIRRLHRRLNDFLETVTLADLLESKVDVTLQHVGVEK